MGNSQGAVGDTPGGYRSPLGPFSGSSPLLCGCVLGHPRRMLGRRWARNWLCHLLLLPVHIAGEEEVTEPDLELCLKLLDGNDVTGESSRDVHTPASYSM